ncbi:MAG: hypothetical protein AzoDbin1_02113 [Azoarcus sp.]|nr:hypothetical protein [Azoarcus sp.]
MHSKHKVATRSLVLKANAALIRSSSGTFVIEKSTEVAKRPRLTSQEINKAYATAVKELDAA